MHSNSGQRGTPACFRSFAQQLGRAARDDNRASGAFPSSSWMGLDQTSGASFFSACSRRGDHSRNGTGWAARSVASARGCTAMGLARSPPDGSGTRSIPATYASAGGPPCEGRLDAQPPILVAGQRSDSDTDLERAASRVWACCSKGGRRRRALCVGGPGGWLVCRECQSRWESGGAGHVVGAAGRPSAARWTCSASLRVGSTADRPRGASSFSLFLTRPNAAARRVTKLLAGAEGRLGANWVPGGASTSGGWIDINRGLTRVPREL